MLHICAKKDELRRKSRDCSFKGGTFPRFTSSIIRIRSRHKNSHQTQYIPADTSPLNDGWRSLPFNRWSWSEERRTVNGICVFRTYKYVYIGSWISFFHIGKRKHVYYPFVCNLFCIDMAKRNNDIDKVLDPSVDLFLMPVSCSNKSIKGANIMF